MLTRRRWLLYALLDSPDDAMTPVQIQKTMFLFGQEAGAELGGEFYSFTPYAYGPFDSTIYRDLEYLEDREFVRRDWPRRRRVRRYFITRPGREKARELQEREDSGLRDYLTRLVHWVKEQSFSDLIRSVYAAYPDYAVNSVFRKP